MGDGVRRIAHILLQEFFRSAQFVAEGLSSLFKPPAMWKTEVCRTNEQRP
jgi:hypothetical protein